MERFLIEIRGVVQGVGFRPFIYRKAKSMGLKGFVRNTREGVEVEVEGERSVFVKFFKVIVEEKPVPAKLFGIKVKVSEPVYYKDFEIKPSTRGSSDESFIQADISVCEDCLRELFDVNNRRYLYPFINCTNCGPRFTVIEKLPYDRENTTMKKFTMCEYCLQEYENIEDRRFHAQPNACWKCGPSVYLLTQSGEILAEGFPAIRKAGELIREGKIGAVKGVGGFHLMCDAVDDEAVCKLRERKKRPEKPFAVMFRDIEQAREFLIINKVEERVLLSPQRPIVLVEGRGTLAPAVAPGLKKIGAFLPYSPLHHILLSLINIPLVATSANISGEPIVKDNEKALKKLKDIADFFLIHDREIKRRCDDSVVKVVGGFPVPLRRSRGYAPLPVKVRAEGKKKVLGIGAMLKNTFAFNVGNKVIMSQHIGDVDNIETLENLKHSVEDLLELFGVKPEAIVCDLHPSYETTKLAEEISEREGIPLYKIQHHYAHILSCMAENLIEKEVFGIAWDGTGYGEDGNIWGGEFLLCDTRGYGRLFHFKYFKLIGGEKAIKEPFRVALSLLFEMYGKEGARHVIERMPSVEGYAENLFLIWKKGINSPLCSSAGRLFDCAGFLLGVKDKNNYEGQIAIMMEDLYDPYEGGSYPFELREGEVDWRGIVEGLLEEKDKRKGVSRFINTMAEIVLRISEIADKEIVCLSGGVMQNDPLVSKIKELLKRKKIKVVTHKEVPPGDGGISLGQVYWGLCNIL